VNPSATTVDALARALKLFKAEHAHLKALARDDDVRAFAIESVPGQIRRLLDHLKPPAYVTDGAGICSPGTRRPSRFLASAASQKASATCS
jgi:hypothetical protein